MFSPNEELLSVETRPGVSKREPKSDPAVIKVMEWSFKAGTPCKEHAHGVPELTYVVKGKVKVRIGDEERILGAGSYYYTELGVPHHLVEILEDLTQIVVSAPALEVIGKQAHEHSDHEHSHDHPHDHQH